MTEDELDAFRDQLLPGLYGSCKSDLELEMLCDYVDNHLMVLVYSPSKRIVKKFYLTQYDLISGAYKAQFKPQLDRLIEELQ